MPVPDLPGGTLHPVVLSGVTRGLGRALIRRYASLGFAVSGCGRDHLALRDLAVELGRADAPALLDRVDVTDAAQVDAWAEKVQKELGPPGLVIANAGVAAEPAPLWEVLPADFEAVLRANVVGVYTMVRAFLPRLAVGGTLIAMSSGWGRSPRGMLAPYTASKFAVEGLIGAVAAEAAAARPDLRVFALDPGGGVDTAMLATCLPGENHGYPTPEEWAVRAVDFLQHRLPTERSAVSLTVSEDN